VARIDDARAFLNDPTRVRFYTEDELEAAHNAEEDRLCRIYPSGRFAHKRKPYVRKTEAERAANLERPSHLDAHADDSFRADLLLKQWERNGWKQLDVTVPSRPDTLVGIP
jgi:hypothetical protein